MSKNVSLYERRKMRVRTKLRTVANGRPRLSIFRSGQHIYAQIIDDCKSTTLVSASSVDKELRSKIKNGGNKASAEMVGKAVAERAIKAGVKEVVFDRGGYLYHGRVKTLAEAARSAGLAF